MTCARRRRTTLRGLHPQNARTVSGTQIECWCPGFPRARRQGARHPQNSLPDVMNHNLKPCRACTREARPGADYAFSLNLLKNSGTVSPSHQKRPDGGLGRNRRRNSRCDARHARSRIDMLTIGQYLAPSTSHLPVRPLRIPTPSRCSSKRPGKWASATPPWAHWCRSSYHADRCSCGRRCLKPQVCRLFLVLTRRPRSAFACIAPPAIPSMGACWRHAYHHTSLTAATPAAFCHTCTTTSLPPPIKSACKCRRFCLNPPLQVRRHEAASRYRLIKPVFPLGRGCSRRSLPTA